MILEEICGVKPGDPIPADINVTRKLTHNQLDFAVSALCGRGYTVIHESPSTDHESFHITAKRHRRCNEPI